MPHPGPEIETEVFFFLVTVFLHFSSPQEVGSLEVGIYYMA